MKWGTRWDKKIQRIRLFLAVAALRAHAFFGLGGLPEEG